MVFRWSLSDTKSPQVSKFFTPALAMVFHWSLSDTKSPQVSKFFTPTLADGFPLEFKWQQVSSSLQDSS